MDETKQKEFTNYFEHHAQEIKELEEHIAELESQILKYEMTFTFCGGSENLIAYIDELVAIARNDALEAAARLLDDTFSDVGFNIMGKAIAEKIRSMKVLVPKTK